MGKNIKIASNLRRRQLTAGASLAVLAAFAPMAHGQAVNAQSLIDTLAGVNSASVSGTGSLPNNQANFDTPISATISGATVSQADTQSGVGSFSSSTLSNYMGALATGSVASNSVALSTMGGLGLNEGTAIASSQYNGGLNAYINALVENSSFTQTHDALSNSAAAVNGNTILAQTTQNNVSSSAAGVLPLGLTSTGPATIINQNLTSNGVDANGTIVVSNGQMALGDSFNTGTPRSNAIGAEVSGNTVSLDVNPTTGATVTSNPQVLNNTIAADNFGNSATASADILAGNAPTFTGSVAVSNTQQNLAGYNGADTTGVGAPLVPDYNNSATNLNSTISGTVGGTSTLSGALTVDGNTVSAQASGNSAIAPTGAVAGNQVVVANGMNVNTNSGQASVNVSQVVPIGTGTVAVNTTPTTYIAPAVGGATQTADLNVSNLQVLSGTYTEGVNGQSATGGTPYSFTYTINTTAGDPSLYTLQNSGAYSGQYLYSGNVTIVNAGPNAVPAADIAAAGFTLVSQSGNTGTYSSANPIYVTSVQEAGATAPSGAVSIPLTSSGTLNNGLPQISAIPSITVANVVAAQVTSPRLSATSNGLTVNASIDLSSNIISASGSGNTASNAVAAGGNTTDLIAASSAVSNQQINDYAPVIATVTAGGNDMIAATANNGADQSSITVNNNKISANATGVSAGNTIGLTATTLDAGLGSNAASVAQILGVNAGATATGGAVVASNQQLADGSYVAALVSDVIPSGTFNQYEAGIENYLYGTLNNSTYTANSNQISAVAQGTNAGNGLALTGTSADVSGVVSNQQLIDNTSGVSAQLLAPYINVDASNVTGSTAQQNSNVFRGLAYGNVDNSTLTLTATNAVLDNTKSTASTYNATTALNGTSVAANGALLVASTQIQDGNVYGYVATGTAGELVAMDLSTIDTSAASVSKNAVVAAGYGNTATNGITIAAAANLGLASYPTNASAAALVNSQVGAGSVSAIYDTYNSPSNTGYALTGASVTSSTVNVDANTIEALAIGSNSGGVVGIPGGNSISVTANAINTYGVLSPDLVISAGNIYNAADFALQNVQAQSGAVSADLIGGEFYTGLTSVDASQVSVSGNSGLALAYGATAGNAITLTATSIDATAGLQSFQNVTNGVSANAENVWNYASVAGSVTNSTVAVSSNTTQALATGGLADNSLTTAGTIVYGAGGAGAQGNATVVSDLGVQNAQELGANVTATISNGNNTSAYADVYGNLLASAVNVNGNKFLANATGLQTSNSSSLTGSAASNATTDVQSSQFTLGNISATAGTTLGSGLASPGGSSEWQQAYVSGAVTDSTVSVSNSQVQAVTTANNASNSITVTGDLLNTNAGVGGNNSSVYAYWWNGINNTLKLANGTADASMTGPGSNVTGAAAYLVGNTQDISGYAQSALAAGFAGISVDTNANLVSNSTLTVNGNAQLASATGNTATNSLGITGNQSQAIYSTGVTPVLLNSPVTGGVVSAQYVDGSSTNATSQQYLYAPAEVLNSTVTVNSNTNSAQALVNGVTNTVSATVALGDYNNYNAAVLWNSPTADPFITGLAPANATADLFIVNSQSALVGVNTTAGQTVLNTDAAGTTTGSGAQTTNSSVSLSLNANNAQSLINEAVNGLTISGNQIAATGAIANTQSFWGETGATTSATQNVALATSVNGQTGTSPNLTTIPAAVNSTLAVNGNANSALTIGNKAANNLAASASAGFVGSYAASSIGEAGPVASYVLGNAQLNNTILTEANATQNLTLNTANNKTPVNGNTSTSLQNSTATIDANTNSATAAANVASNTISVNGNNAASSALSSMQLAETGVSTNAAQNISYGADALASSIAVSNNTNAALSVGNDVSNSASLTAVNTGSPDGGWNAYSGTTGGNATPTNAQGDVALGTKQTNYNTIYATAITSVSNAQNADIVLPPATQNYYDTTLNASSLTVSGNQTDATAIANRANNTVLASAVNNPADAALSSQQDNTNTVGATAQTTVINGYAGTGAVVDGSSLTVGSNLTQAVATANQATNAMTASAAGSYAGASYGSANGSTNGSGANASGQFVVLNSQNNSGAVNATAQNVVYSTLNYSNGSTAVMNSTVAMNGNTVNAAATGNSSTNSLTMTALNTGNAGGIVTNAQYNSGAVTAVATSVTFGFTSGGVSASSMVQSANQVVAQATGNRAVNSILGK